MSEHVVHVTDASFEEEVLKSKIPVLVDYWATAARLVYPHIVKKPGYCGGKAAIGGTRVRVNNVVFFHKQGKTPAEILVEYSDLGLAQVHAALGRARHGRTLADTCRPPLLKRAAESLADQPWRGADGGRLRDRGAADSGVCAGVQARRW